MKNIYFALLFILPSFIISGPSAFAAKTLNLNVIDQNFNSTEKIIIDQEEIRKSRASSLPALLASKANISISTTNLQPNSIYIRGGDSSHVLILVDGVPTYDASSPQRTINLFNLNLSKIKRIEILKGSQSVLYGGQAMSGVIKIETFSEENQNATTLITDTALTSHWGNRQTLSVDTLHNLSQEMAVTASAFGLMARNPSPVLGSAQIYPQQSGAAEIGLQIKNEYENIFKLNYSRDDNQISNADFNNSKAIDTKDFYAETESIGGVWILRKNNEFNLTVSQQKIDRAFDQDASKSATGLMTDEKYLGILSNIRLDGSIFKNEFVNLIAGLQYSEESMYSTFRQVTATDDKTQYEGIYLKSDFLLPQNFLLEYGMRQENTKNRSLASTYHLGLIWNQMIKAEYSTGFKTPSLFQLYSKYGNSDLIPETSKNFSLSFEHQFNDQFYSSLTCFDAQFENLIDFSFATLKYNNVSKTRTVGLESQTDAQFIDGRLRISLALGYQEPRDISRNQWLVRRSLRSASLKISTDLSANLNTGAEIIHTGEKLDKSGPQYLTVEDYTLINIFGNFKLSQTTNLFARIENLENKVYETTYGFYNDGSIYKIGAQLNF